jgi:hypothetical protein
MNQTLLYGAGDENGFGAALMIVNTHRCSVYHNSFINNERSTDCSGIDPGDCIFDNGYPSGGNYWSDYNGTDSYQGQFQNETGSDGIDDEPYLILYSQNCQDRYPLMNPSANRDSADINCDGRVDIADVAMTSAAFGTHEGYPQFEPLCDINHDNRIDIMDLAVVSAHFGRHL